MKLLLSLSLAVLALANPIEKRQYVGQNTENQLTDGTPCRAITILFARGTTESGNVGTLAGPPFFQAVVGKVGASKVAVQGVCLTPRLSSPRCAKGSLLMPARFCDRSTTLRI